MGLIICANYCTWLHLVDGCEGSMRPPEHHTGAFARARVEMGTICPNMGVLEYCSGDKGERDIAAGEYVRGRPQRSSQQVMILHEITKAYTERQSAGRQ